MIADPTIEKLQLDLLKLKSEKAELIERLSLSEVERHEAIGRANIKLQRIEKERKEAIRKIDTYENILSIVILIFAAIFLSVCIYYVCDKV